MTKTSYTLIYDPILIHDGGLKPGFRVYGLELYYMLQYYCVTEGSEVQKWQQYVSRGNYEKSIGNERKVHKAAIGI